jgi:hypothetical protein
MLMCLTIILSADSYGAMFLESILSTYSITKTQLYMSPSNQKIRLDGSYDGALQASLLDFSNTTSDGLVANAIFSYIGGLTNPTCSSYLFNNFFDFLSLN